MITPRCPRSPRATLALAARWCSLGLLVASTAVSAQRLAPGQVAPSLTLTGLGQLDTDLDQGGRFGWSGFDLNGSVTRQFTPALSLGLTARYQAEYWSFDPPAGTSAKAPWTDILRPSLGVNVGYSLAPDLALFVSPQVEWSYETGASAADGLNYGAVLGLTKFFSPTLFVGVGLGAFRQVDRNQYFPLLIVNWQISDSLRLSNPLRAGPAGGAGIELVYSIADQWELAGGAAYRSYRFRLNNDGPAPGGVGQNAGAPVFARLTRNLGPAAQIDLYAGVVASGQIKLLNAAGATVQSSDYHPAPLLALSGSFRF